MVLALPFDNVCSILMLLPLKTLVRCARVNRTWNHLISSTPLLWQHLTFRGNSHPLSATTLALYLSRLHLAPLLSVTIPNAQDSTGLLIALCNSNCSQLYELDLTYIQCTSQQCWNLICQLMRLAGKTLRVLRLCCGSFRLNSIVDLLSTTCLRLEILDLHNCFPLKDDRPYHNVTTLEHLEQFGGRLPSHLLDHAAGLHILPIQRLVLSDLYGLTSLQLAILLLRCPRLMDLSLLHCSVNIIPAINLLRYSNVEGFHYYRNNQSMVTNLAPAATSETVSTTTTREQGYEVHLHQEYQREGGSLHTPRINSALEKGSSIGDTVTWKRLILQQTQGLTDDILSSLLVNSCHTIVKLDLKGNRQLTDDCFLAMYQRRTDGGMLPLVELGLSNCTGMTEIGLCILFQHTPQLQQLDLSGLINVTDQVLETIALHCPRLLKLDLTHCRTFTDSGIRTFIDSSLRLSPLQHLGLIGTTLSIDALAYAMCHVH
ncbi:hypothetical protein BC941DRAFT_412036 [Chlamydoabsidia padenii]|nr:hypothetical protein BC941DRAFT_412036 [Chlamydoabsidia padenii]